MWEQRGLSGGCWEPRAKKPQQAAAQLDHQSAIRIANSLCVCIRVCACVCVSDWVHRAQHSPCSMMSELCFTPLSLRVQPLARWDQSPLAAVWSNPSSLSLSLPVCLSLQPSLPALTLCHLTALSPNQAPEGNFKRFSGQKNKHAHWKQILQSEKTTSFTLVDQTVPRDCC